LEKSGYFYHWPVWVLLIGLVGAGLAWVSASLGWIDTISTFTAVFLGIFIEAAPYLLLGTLASGLVEVFFKPEELARWVPRRALFRALAGGLSGMFMPVCECGVVPLTRRLLRKGMPLSMGVAFLLAAPVLNPIVIASTWAAFGNTPIFWGRLILSFGVAVGVGLIFSAQPDAQRLLRPGVLAGVSPGVLAGAGLDDCGVHAADCTCSVDDAPSATDWRARWQRVLVITADEFFEMGRYLVAGALLAACLQTFIPQTMLLNLGRGPFLSVLVMVVLAVLLSICSTVDAFIALAFVGTFTTGSILAFLVYGPMVDIKSVLMFLQVFERRTVFYLVALPLMMVLVLAVALNFAAIW